MELKIFGPKGDPGSTAAPTRYTQVPWEQVAAEDKKKEEAKAKLQATISESRIPRGDYVFSDKNAIIR